jgi:hypothetical protein
MAVKGELAMDSSAAVVQGKPYVVVPPGAANEGPSCDRIGQHNSRRVDSARGDSRAKLQHSGAIDGRIRWAGHATIDAGVDKWARSFL